MTPPALHEIDPSIFDGMAPPREFVESCYCAQDLMERLNIDDASTFWLAYREGRIPRGVTLPSDPPMTCWDRAIIEKWIECGCPRDPVHQAHEHLVLQRLLDCVRAQLSAHPPTLAERN